MATDGAGRGAGRIEQYGVDVVMSVMQGTIELSEKSVRERLRKLPDGIYRAQTFLDHDGVQNKLYRIHVEVTKTGDELTLDFSKSADQAPRFMNCTESGLLAGVRARRNAVSPYLGVTIDQVIAQKYGQDTILSSIQLGVEDTGNFGNMTEGGCHDLFHPSRLARRK